MTDETELTSQHHQLHNALDYQTQFEVAKIEQDREEQRHNERAEREKERIALETERERERLERVKEREKLEADLIEKKIKREKTFRMSEKTVQDTIGVKIMTIVALIYLPSTFVAVSFTAISPKLAHILTLRGFCLDFFTSRYHKIQN